MALYNVSYAMGWAVLVTTVEGPDDVEDYTEIEDIANAVVWEQLGFGVEHSSNDITVEELS